MDAVSENAAADSERAVAASAPSIRAVRVPDPVRALIARLAAYYAPGAAAAGRSAAGAAASVQLAEAAIRASDAAAAAAETRPFQIAVLGPTQTGKSTIVNLILGANAAGVSPLAGFTVHAQGFRVVTDSLQPPAPARAGAESDGAFSWIGQSFRDFRRVAPTELSRDRLDQYAIAPVDPPPELTMLPPLVVWDAPDFDSLAAGAYQQAVLEIAAIADMLVFVLSKEKYADLSVWRMLQMLAPLRRPLVVVLNKLTPDVEDPVVKSLRERMRGLGEPWRQTPIVSVAHHPQLEVAPDSEPIGAAALRREVAAQLASAESRSVLEQQAERVAGIRRLIEAHWDPWLAPIHSEHAAAAEWNRRIDDALEQFLTAYRRDYLDHPQRYDSFRRAAVELLRLLEIPRIASAVTHVRQAVTWPVRQVWRAGRALVDAHRNTARGARRLGAESAVLVEAVDALLTALQRDLLRRCAAGDPAPPIWRLLATRLHSEEARLRADLEAAIETHHAAVTREIHRTADQLYQELKKSPARLAALRAARASIDVGYLLLAVKTAGITPMDVIWAPATFALTSLLAEGMAGLQMHSIASDLKTRQLRTVRENLVDRVLAAALRGLADNPGDGCSGISPRELDEAAHALKAWGALCV